MPHWKKKGIEAIQKVKIEFDWTHSNGSKGTGELRSYKERLLTGELLNSDKSEYRKIKIYT